MKIKERRRLFPNSLNLATKIAETVCSYWCSGDFEALHVDPTLTKEQIQFILEVYGDRIREASEGLVETLADSFLLEIHVFKGR